MNIYDSVIAGATNGKYNSISSYFTGQNNINFEKSLDTFKDLLDKAEKADTTGVISDAIKEAKESLEGIEAMNKSDELATTFKKLEVQAKKDEEMFKTFDFMQLMTQLMYGTNDESEKSKLYQKMNELAASVKNKS
ncbi:hypothetical protein PTQ35_01080 [Campylobacter sp. 46490-21]|uniref:hypothetical protein n=1 Tax=Campylobacter magnus TaxID=3026462 RepID=UPI002361F7B4|nr:hypothetical protein [Campylobacter magnus]MDD0847408.1 hypothetical protein [Campylobacter magnus]